MAEPTSEVIFEYGKDYSRAFENEYGKKINLPTIK